MSGSIKDVTDAINAQLTAVLTALADPAQPVPVYDFGEDRLYIENAAPRIVWVPKGGKTDAEIIPAADNAIQFGQSLPYGAYPDPRPLWTRHPRVEAHVWGIRANAETDTDATKDYKATEILANHLVAAAQFVAFGSYQPGSEDWPKSQGEAVRFGVEMVIGFELKIPWVDEGATLAEITHLEVIEGTAHQ